MNVSDPGFFGCQDEAWSREALLPSGKHLFVESRPDQRTCDASTNGLEFSDPNTFRVKIWCEGGVEVVVYHNGFDQELGAGSIVIDTKR